MIRLITIQANQMDASRRFNKHFTAFDTYIDWS